MRKQMDSEEKIDSQVISDFGDEWATYNYEKSEFAKELKLQFEMYSNLVNFQEFNPHESVAADFGAGTGRWAEFILDNFKKVYLVEPSQGAFEVLTKKFKSKSHVSLENSTISESAIPNNSLDFAMSLGVLHHISNTEQALKDINSKLKGGGLFLGYLYYKVENKPFLYRVIFSLTNYLRKRISNLSFKRKRRISYLIALFVYLPLAKLTKGLKMLKINTSNIPLHQYANLNFYMMKNDALDRFGTKLEKRFNKVEIVTMLVESGFDQGSINFSESEPFWTFSARKLKT
jgi:ubiquinone/menaquinone biosynthesis C-methylase UbiE